MAKLSHPAVVAVHDVGLFGNKVFVAMEFVEGQTLRAWMRPERRPWREVVSVFLEAGQGLQAAHDAGLIHRDFKPSNVIIGGDGRVRVLDFGLARRAEQGDEAGDPSGASPSATAPAPLMGAANGEISMSMSRSSLDMQLTQAGSVMGSPAYMSPEQHMSRQTEPRSDQFGFCVSLFEALYGQRPFVSEDQRTLVYAILEQRIRTPPRDSHVPKSVHRAVVRGLAVNPADRYPSMAELLADLRRDPGRSARRWLVGLVGLSAIAAGVAVMWPQHVSGEAQQRVEQLASAAHVAAAKSAFVYPPADHPDHPTAYGKVLELEQLDGELKRAAQERAAQLRQEFATTLVYLGDRYWEEDGGKPFAIDYYAQALVFDDSNARAKERAALTVGQLSDLRRKADESDFSQGELAAAEPLAALAEDDDERRQERLEELLETSTDERAASTEAKLSKLLEKSEQRPKPEREVTRRERVPTQPASGQPGIGAAADAESDEPVPGARTATKSKHDPGHARELAEQGNAALRAANWQEASKLFHQALSYDRKSTAALIGLSDVHFDRGEHSKAIDYAQRAVAAAPKNSGYRIKLGDAYFKALRYDDAKAEYTEAASLGDGRAQKRLDKIKRALGE
jgi:Flp pilus assembly protein TadD